MNIRKFSNALFVNVNYNKAYISNKITDLSFSAQTLCNTISFLIDNCFIKYDCNVYRQVLGIPMETSCAPYLANIFLYVYEKKAVTNLADEGRIDDASSLANIFRYQDDCIVLNDKGLLDTIYQDIYPEELTLLNTNVSPCKVTFLDMVTSLHRGKFKHCLYYKRDDFNFSVISYPFLSGNIPKVPSYGVCTSQLLRHICSEYNQFKCGVIKLKKKRINQGFQLLSVKHKFELFSKKYILG